MMHPMCRNDAQKKIGTLRTTRQSVTIEFDVEDTALVEAYLDKWEPPKFSGTLTITYDPPLQIRR